MLTSPYLHHICLLLGLSSVGLKIQWFDLMSLAPPPNSPLIFLSLPLPLSPTTLYLSVSFSPPPPPPPVGLESHVMTLRN